MADKPRSPSRHVLVRIPSSFESADGGLQLQPHVQVVDAPQNFDPGLLSGPTGPGWIGEGLVKSGEFSQSNVDWLDRLQPVTQELPLGAALGGDLAPRPPGAYDAWHTSGAEPVFGGVLADLESATCPSCEPLSVVFNPANHSGDIGIGRDRLILAPFEMDSSQPSNNTLFRVDLANGFPTPDRSEYFWAKPKNKKGKGPNSPERGVDYQDLRFRTEIGGERFSASTEIPLRSLDPIDNGNTTGMGDMNVATKTVMLDGKSWQLTQIFRTYMPTGAFGKGLGTGHVALEPGILATYRLQPTSVFHGELKYWFPVGGDPNHSGPVLRAGLGYSQLLHETDAFAIIHTGEFVGFWFLDGEKIVNGAAQGVDGEPAFQIYPGIRFVADTGGDFGLVELGFAGTFSMGERSLLDNLMRIDLRFSY